MKAQFKPGKVISEQFIFSAKPAKAMPETTNKMQRIQATKSSFKFRLCAMLALKPISSNFSKG